jgi:hypothetical protein
MKRLAISLALLCMFSVPVLAGDVPTCGLPAAGNIPTSGEAGEIPIGGIQSSGDLPTCGLVLTILDLLL